MLKNLFNFRFRLIAAIFLVAVAATVSGLIYYYQMARTQIWGQMTNRVKDFGKLGISMLSPDDLRYLEKLDIQINGPRYAAAPQAATPGPVLAALSDDEKTAIIRTTSFQIIVQKLRRLRYASARTAAHDTILPAANHSEGDKPQIHRAWIAGVRMHQHTPMHLRVICADEFEEIDRNNNSRIDPEEKIYHIGDIFGGKNQPGVSAALGGDITVGNGYRTESSGVYISGYTPVRNSKGQIIALLVIDFSAATEFDALFNLKVTGYYIIVAVLLLSIMAASATSRILLRPLDEMQRAAVRIGQRDFSVRIERNSSDELSDLAFAINLMAQELGEYSTQMERRIAARTSEISGILAALEQGVFTIDRRGTIQAEYSTATLAFFGVRELAHRRLSDLFSDEKLSAAVEKYIEVCFTARDISAPMLEKANPLRQVTYQNAIGETRHLRFSFRPLSAENETQRLLVTVVDETYGITLKQKISLAEADRRTEYDALINMMRVPAPILDAFLEQQREFLREGKRIIGAFGDNPGAFSGFAAKVHALKGNALQLGFLPLAELLHETEDFLDQAANSSAADQRFLRHELSRCINACEGLILNRDKLVARIRELVGETQHHDPATGLSQLREFWINQIRKKATEYGIAADIKVEFASGTEPALHRLHNVIVQLLRNTFAHGAETAAERSAKGKAGPLQVHLQTTRSAGATEITYREDGRGFAGLPPGQPVPVQSLLQKGLTAPGKSATLETGRGLGMEYIATNLAEMRGAMTVTSSATETVFRIQLPE